jgi:outer membrane protein TolC
MLHASFVWPATLIAGLVVTGALRGDDEVRPPALEGESWRSQMVGLIRAAVSGNLDLRAMKLEVDAARHRVPQSRALPDPELELALEDIPVHSPSLTRDEFTMEVVTYRQALPARGEREARRVAAVAEVDGVLADHRTHVLEVASDTADSFFALAGVDHKLAILRDSRLRLEDATAVATERFRVGQGQQADVLRASLRLTQLDETILTLQSERRALVARLNAVLGRSSTTPIDLVAPLTEDLDQQIPVPSIEELERLAEERSPDVRAAEAAVAAATAELRMVESERRPGWMLSSYYGRREEFDDFFGVSAAVSLPWARRSRLAEKQAEKEAAREAAEVALLAVRARLRGGIGEAYAELERMRQQLRLYRNVVLPQAEVHLGAAREAYAVGRVDFLTFVNATTEIDEYQQAAADRAAGIGRAVAALQRASGVPLLPGTPEQGDDDVAH